MRTVFQKDPNGCWIACAAMLSGMKYKSIKSRFKFREGVTVRSARPLVLLLDKLGVDCEEKSTKVSDIESLRYLKCDALVYFKNLDEKGKETSGHWMVWDHREKVIRDPKGWAADISRKIKNFRRVSGR